MYTQKVFRTGNSQVVAIPSFLAENLGLKVGTEVVISKSDDEQGIIIKKITQDLKVADRPSQVDKEFKSWLNHVLKEDEEILDQLSVR